MGLSLRRRGAVLGLAVLVALAAAAQATPLHQTPRVLASGGTPPYARFQWEPFRIVYSGDGAALVAGRGGISNHLRWTTWNHKEGLAWGANWHDNCIPSCAQGTYFAYRANVRVYRPRQVGTRLLFTRLTVTYTGARPPYPAYPHRSITYELRVDAVYNDFFWTRA